jgi:hypothetical protein
MKQSTVPTSVPGSASANAINMRQCWNKYIGVSHILFYSDTHFAGVTPNTVLRNNTSDLMTFTWGCAVMIPSRASPPSLPSSSAPIPSHPIPNHIAWLPSSSVYSNSGRTQAKAGVDLVKLHAVRDDPSQLGIYLTTVQRTDLCIEEQD